MAMMLKPTKYKDGAKEVQKKSTAVITVTDLQ